MNEEARNDLSKGFEDWCAEKKAQDKGYYQKRRSAADGPKNLNMTELAELADHGPITLRTRKPHGYWEPFMDIAQSLRGRGWTGGKKIARFVIENANDDIWPWGRDDADINALAQQIYKEFKRTSFEDWSEVKAIAKSAAESLDI